VIAPLFDRCVICGRPVYKLGERLCIFHDVRYCIELGAQRMRERARQAVSKRKMTKAQTTRGTNEL
jgi:hypothetical protein